MMEVPAGQTSKSLKKGWYLAISPDGQYILTFNSNTFQYKIIKMENKEKLFEAIIDKKKFPNFELHKRPSDKDSEFPMFKIALSNIFANSIFVAISFVIKNDMLANNDNKLHGTTIIYRTMRDLKDHWSDHSFHHYFPKGGMVNFVHYKDEKMHCFIFNSSGIFSYTYRIKDLSRYIKQHYFYPMRLQDELTNLYKFNSCLKRIRACMFDEHFLIEQYNEGTQSIQLFSLVTMEMEQIFQKKLDRSLTKKFARPIFSISKNKYLLMFSRGIETILIFYIENGLEIARKSFGKGTKIMFGEFINGDEGLLLIIKEKRKFSIKIWDLFDASENQIRTYDSDEYLDVKMKSYNARCPGNLLTIDADGTVSSIIDKWISKEIVREISKKDHYDCKLIPPGENIMSLHEDQGHCIYHRNPDNTSLKPLVSDKEPWVYEIDYERTSAYLDEEETIQLIIGRTTVQVWRKNKDGSILEFIWANKTDPSDNDKVESENALKIEELTVGIKSFYLKVKWVYNNVDQSVEIKWPSTDGHVTDVIHACAALAHVNCRKNNLVGYKKRHKYEKLMNYISLLIWKFIKKKQETWKLLDVRYNVMADIIIGGSTFLIKFILLDEVENEKELKKTGNRRLLHIPQLRRWNNETVDLKVHNGENQSKELLLNYESTDLTDLQIAIRLCSKDPRRVNRHIVIVGYLLEYYTTHATRNLGWLITVSKALPELYNDNHELLNYYAREIFFKKCFKGLELSDNIDYRDFMPLDVEKRRQKSQKFIAFCPNTKLVVKEKNRRLNLEVLQEILITIYFKIYQKIFPNPFKNIPPLIHIVPLYEFTTSDIVKKQIEDQKKVQTSFLVKLFQLLFLPRRYLLKDTGAFNNLSQLSPFIQIIRAAKDNNVFNNPTMEATINQRWYPARNYFLQLYFQFILYATCFAVLCEFYLSHVEITGKLNQYTQLEHHGWKRYFEFFNFFDLLSTILPLVIMSTYIITSFKFSNGFADVITTKDISIYISFTMLILWFEFILYLRLLSVLAAFAHSMFILLQHPTFTDVTPKTDEYSLTNTTTKEPIDVTVTGEIDPSDRLDNPNSNIIDSLISSYFWIGGSYVQRDTWDFWAVEALTLLASIFVVTVLQNMFIAFMGGIYSDAHVQASNALLRFRAENISDYEALDDVHFLPLTPDPKYICYVGRSSSYETWKNLSNAKSHTLYHKYEEKITEIKGLYEVENLEDKNCLWKWDDGNVDHDDTD
ncbi:3160_t:CDS:2, partial [Funneliformis mosseae]